MSTHRSRARRPGTLPSGDRSPRSGTQVRDDGRRRITGATSLTALGGTALAVVFGALFAQGTSAAETAPPAAPLVQEAQAVLGTSGAHRHGDPAPPAPTTTAAPPAATSKQSASKQSASKQSASKPPATARQTTDAPAPPTVAPRSTAGEPTASSGGS